LRAHVFKHNEAEAQGIATRVCSHRDYASREAFDEALRQAVDGLTDQAPPDWVVLAGFMRILTPAFVEHYDGRLLNLLNVVWLQRFQWQCIG